MTSEKEGEKASEPPPTQQDTQNRPRAPTISIDDSALSPPEHTPTSPTLDRPVFLPRIQTEGLEDPPRTSSTFTSSPVDFRGSTTDGRPTSPHNVSSPTRPFVDGAGSFLAVPSHRERAGSADTDTGSHNGSSYGGDTYAASTTSTAEPSSRRASFNNEEVMNDDQALQPDPGTEEDFQVEDNKFAFSSGQLNKMINPKSLAAFHALGGLAGLEKGLRTNRQSGLSVDELGLEGNVTFDEAIKAGHDADVTFEAIKRRQTSGSMTAAPPISEDAFSDRKRIYKDNRLPEKKAKTFWQLAWIAYNDKVLILLSVAAVVSLALGIYQTLRPPPGEENEAHVEWVEGVAIIVAILIVTFVGALNDFQKERQFVKLNKKKEERFVKVIRSGKSQEISVYDILVGDVMHLEPGDLIPVDGIFIDGHNVRCDESSATGESDILRKYPADDVYHAIEHHQSLNKMDPFILSGGKVTEGVGTFLVTSVGVNSSYGKILMSLQDEGQTTPLQSKLNVLAEYIAKLGLASGLLLFVVAFIKFLAQLHSIQGGSQAKGQQFLQIFIVAVTVVVVAVPEGLPLAVTLALAFATTRMMKDNNLVRLLRACETMENATTVCSDKTGTLTQNKMSVVAGTIGTSSRFGDVQQKLQGKPAHEGDSPQTLVGTDDVSAHECVAALGKDTKELLKDSIVLNSTAFEAEENGKNVFVGSKTETALLSFADDFLDMEQVSHERANAYIAQMIPFDSGRKCMGVVIKLANGKYRLLVKGASEILVSKCTRIIADPARGTSEVSITRDNMETLNAIVNNYASRSLRTIGMVYRDHERWPPKGAAMAEDPRYADFDKVFKDMVFLSVVGIQDPLRPGVTEAVRQCQQAGVFVRMVTGDNLTTAKAIATECGIFTPGGIAMEGPVFRRLGNKELMQTIPRLQVLARSSPEDKKLLVGQLKKLGETVAVTGDGTNDAPALKTADVGFSMGIAGTEVAKEASAIILMDDNFASIVKAISWGRAVNDAVKKFLQFQLTVNITAVVLTFISAVASETENSVLTAVQLLWVNLIMDTFAALALATDPPTPSILLRRPEPKSAPLITITMWKMIIGQAIYQLAVTLVLYFAGARILSYQTEHEKKALQTTVFNTFVWMQIFNQYACRRLDNGFNIFEGMFRNYWFLAIQIIIVGGQLLIIFVGGAAFSINHLNGAQWAYSIILGSLSIPVSVIIRLIPDEVFTRFIPNIPHRKPSGPTLMVEDDERLQQWNPALEDIREELTFLRKVRGGRMSELAYKLQNPKEMFLPRSRSESRSRSRSNSDIPGTPDPELQPVPSDPTTSSPQTPERRPKRVRSASNSVFSAIAMPGVIAGSVAGGWSPVDRRSEDGAGGGPQQGGPAIRFNRARAYSGLNDTAGIEVHPETRQDDPVIVENPQRSLVPPSQNPDLAPHFEHAPPTNAPSPLRGRRSHSRHSSTLP